MLLLAVEKAVGEIGDISFFDGEIGKIIYCINGTKARFFNNFNT